MRQLMPGFFCVVTCTFLAAVYASPLLAAEGMTVAERSSPTEWTIQYKAKPVLRYCNDPHKFKPYVQALYTTRGYGVLRDSPFDHLHHHALMYGIRVNGINFWEETAGCGVQKAIESKAPVPFESENGLPGARLKQLIFWVAPQDAFLPNTNTPSLLIEHRTVEVLIDESNEETALRWESQFEVGTATNQVTLTGANYHGLGMRFLEELDKVAVHITPQGQVNLANNRQDVAAYGWQALTFDVSDKPATLALFGGKGNARGNPVYFSMRTPFAYISATQGLDKEPLVYKAGDKFQVSYLVTLCPRVQSAEEVERRARRWHSTGH